MHWAHPTPLLFEPLRRRKELWGAGFMSFERSPRAPQLYLVVEAMDSCSRRRSHLWLIADGMWIASVSTANPNWCVGPRVGFSCGS
jgi:hypothetical protein